MAEDHQDWRPNAPTAGKKTSEPISRRTFLKGGATAGAAVVAQYFDLGGDAVDATPNIVQSVVKILDKDGKTYELPPSQYDFAEQYTGKISFETRRDSTPAHNEAKVPSLEDTAWPRVVNVEGRDLSFGAKDVVLENPRIVWGIPTDPNDENSKRFLAISAIVLSDQGKKEAKWLYVNVSPTMTYPHVNPMGGEFIPYDRSRGLETKATIIPN